MGAPEPARSLDLDVGGLERDDVLGEIHATTSEAPSLRWSDDEIVVRFLPFRAAVDATAAHVRARATSAVPAPRGGVG